MLMILGCFVERASSQDYRDKLSVSLLGLVRISLVWRAWYLRVGDELAGKH